MGVLEKLTKLIKRGESKIYFRDITKIYLLIPNHNSFKFYMERLGFVALKDQNNRIYYDLIYYN
jgi:hypothetical protein